MTDPAGPDGPPWRGDSPDAASGEEELASPAGVPDEPTLAPGQLVAGRYRVVRFVAKGGMGEVYEARDTELSATVALKLVRPEVSGSPAALERFRREIQLARRITHPNVCRIIDIGYHGPLAFLTMEMLSGETLTERIRRVGRLTTAEALPIVRQLAAALAAAHDEGIVHRDFKSDNVILASRSRPASGSGGRAAGGVPELRAVVTDFGLARSHLPTGSLSASLTGTGFIVGTPAYMAPEQVAGREAGPAADVYALGLVIYEMVTGTLPFQGESALAIAARRLSEPPIPPRSVAPDLDPVWEATILRCLEREPEDRFPSVTDVAHALSGEVVTPSPRAEREERRTAETRKRRRRRVLLAASIAVLVATAGGLALYRALSRKPPAAPGPSSVAVPPPLPAPPAVLRRSVAVIGFKNLAGRPEAAWLSTALSEMLVAELAAGRRLRTISGENVGRMKMELNLGPTDTLAADTLAKVRANLGADLVVLGSYLALGERAGGKVRLDVHVQDTATGETVATVTENGSETDPAELVARAGGDLRREIALPEPAPAESASARAVLPASGAIPLYAEGLAALRRFDALGARSALEKAVAADPSHALARSALAAAWSDLGWDARAREEAKRAVELSGALSREDRLVVEARLREATNDWGRAVAAWQTLFAFWPDDVDYGVRLATARTKEGRPKDAAATIELLRKLPPPARDDPRLDLSESRACQALGDVRRQLALARRAAGKGLASHLPLLSAEARLVEADALRILGDTKGSRTAAEEAIRVFDSAGHARGAARARGQLATQVFLDGGDVDSARDALEESLQLSRRIGDKAGTAGTLAMLAFVASRKGDPASARTRAEQSLAIYREVGQKRGVAVALSTLAHVALAQGDDAAAQARATEALAVLREVGDERGAGSVLRTLASVAEVRGDLARARTLGEEALAAYRKVGAAGPVGPLLLDLGVLARRLGDLAAARTLAGEAVAAFRQVGDPAAAAAALELAADVALSGGDLRGARAALEEALAASRDEGDARELADRQLALARLALEEGRTAEAGKAARELLAPATSGKLPELQLAAGTLLAETLLKSGEAGEARRTLARVAPLAERSQVETGKRRFALAAVRAAPAAGQPAARRRLAALHAEARSRGDVSFELEARLALLEAEARAGGSPATRTGLEALSRDARAKGFLLVAGKADALRAP